MTEKDKRENAFILLGRLEFPDVSLQIPLIGHLMPAGAEVGLHGLEVAYQSGGLDAAARQKIQNLLPDGTLLPNSLSQGGTSITAGIVAAGVSKSLSVPISKSNQNVKKEPQISDHTSSIAVNESSTELSSPSSSAELRADDSHVAWWDLRKTAGPVHIDRLGIGYKSRRLLLLADISLETNGLTFGTKGLGAEIPLKPPYVPSFHLDGLSLGYDRPPLTIAGEFLRMDMKGFDLALGGMASVGTPALALTALGFYAQPHEGKDPSLFIYGQLDLKNKTIGPPMFRIESLAAGFGYHTSIRTPKLPEVSHFPFVKMLSKSDEAHRPLGVLGELMQGSAEAPAWVTPSPNAIWLAAGIHALVYELVDVSAVAVARFGNDFTVGLYGKAEAQFPRKPANAWARLAVDVLAEYRSRDDVFELSAAVTDDSFIVDPACRLQGEAHVLLWFGGNRSHAGDFVVTMGGYSPAFDKPQHYPDAKRIGFSWNITSGLYTSGACYAALTPHALMAGFETQIHGEWGPFEGEVKVYANGLLEWDPVYFDVDFGGRVTGKAFGVKLFELSAKGHVWGPPVGGHARFDVLWSHVDVDFGAPPRSKARSPLDAKSFRERMLPPGNEKVVQVRPLRGLLPTTGPSERSEAIWDISSEFSLSVASPAPATSVAVNGTKFGSSKGVLHIRPMQDPDPKVKAEEYVSDLEVKLLRDNKPVSVGGDKPESWEILPVSQAVPTALWGLMTDDRTPTGSGMISGYTTSLTVNAPLKGQHNQKTHLSTADLVSTAFDLTIPNVSNVQHFSSVRLSSTQTLAALSTVASDQAVQARAKINEELAAHIPGFAATFSNGSLDRFAARTADLDETTLLYTGKG